MTQPISFADPPMDVPCQRPGCHHDFDEHIAEGDDLDFGCNVSGCSCPAYTDEPQERDPDEIRDRRRFG